MQGRDRLPDDLAAVDEEPALCALKKNAVVTFAGDNHFDVVGHLGSDFEFGGGVVLISNHRTSILVLDRQRVFERRHFAGARVAGSDCSAGNVNVMGSPIGQFPA